MIDLNNCQIIGHVGKDAELRFTPAGKPVSSFTVAYNHRWINSDGEQKETTEWFNVVTWNKLAETCHKFVVKGAMVYVAGRIGLHQWENNEGKQLSRLDLIANRVIFLSGVSNNKVNTSELDIEPEDIPF